MQYKYFIINIYSNMVCSSHRHTYQLKQGTIIYYVFLHSVICYIYHLLCAHIVHTIRIMHLTFKSLKGQVKIQLIGFCRSLQFNYMFVMTLWTLIFIFHYCTVTRIWDGWQEFDHQHRQQFFSLPPCPTLAMGPTQPI